MQAAPIGETVYLVLGSQSLATRIIRREENDLYLDAVRDVDAVLRARQAVWLRWAYEDGLLQQAVRVLEVLDPLPIVHVRLEGRAEAVEPRATPRVRAALDMEYGLVMPRSDHAVATTWDVSAEGLRFLAPVEMWPGLDLEIRLHLDGRSWLLLARVVRVTPWRRPRDEARGFHIAVVFIKPPRAARLALDRFVRRERMRQRRQTPV